MKWLTNRYNPKATDAIDRHIFMNAVETEKEWASYLRWLEDKTIGEPKASSKLTVVELRQMNIVGIYSTEKEKKPLNSMDNCEVCEGTVDECHC